MTHQWRHFARLSWCWQFSGIQDHC